MLGYERDRLASEPAIVAAWIADHHADLGPAMATADIPQPDVADMAPLVNGLNREILAVAPAGQPREPALMLVVLDGLHASEQTHERRIVRPRQRGREMTLVERGDLHPCG